MRLPEMCPGLVDRRVDVRIGIHCTADLVAWVDDVAAAGREVLQPGDVVLRRLLGRAAVAMEEDDQRARFPLCGVEPDLLEAAADPASLLDGHRMLRARAGAAAAGGRDGRTEQEKASHGELDEQAP